MILFQNYFLILLLILYLFLFQKLYLNHLFIFFVIALLKDYKNEGFGNFDHYLNDKIC